MNDSSHPLTGLEEFLRAGAEKFAAEFSAGAAALLRVQTSVRPAGVELLFPGQYQSAITEPTCCFLLGGFIGQEMAQVGRLEFSPQLASSMVDVLLGGPSQRKVGHSLTVVDRHVLGPVVDRACLDCRGAFGTALELLEGVWPMPNEKLCAALVIFQIYIGDLQGTLKLSILESALESAKVGNIHVEISAVIEEQLEAAQLEGIGMGDIIATETSPQGEVVVCVGGVKKYYARLGQLNGKRAITITRKIQ